MPARLCGSAALLALLLGGGCEPSCRDTCDKLLDCGHGVETPRLSIDECIHECDSQASLYEDAWENDGLREAFGDYKQCVIDNECADIADGACHDGFEEIYIW